MAANSVFSKEAIDKVSSPEHLDDYIRVARPSIWICIVAFLILIVSVIVWGFVGTLPETVSANGVISENNELVCYIPVSNFKGVPVDAEAKIILPDGKTSTGKVVSVSANPLSSKEIAGKQQSDWITEQLITSNYAYAVSVSLDETGNLTSLNSDTIVNVTFIVDEVKPIKYILN